MLPLVVDRGLRPSRDDFFSEVAMVGIRGRAGYRVESRTAMGWLGVGVAWWMGENKVCQRERGRAFYQRQGLDATMVIWGVPTMSSSPRKKPSQIRNPQIEQIKQTRW